MGNLCMTARHSFPSGGVYDGSDGGWGDPDRHLVRGEGDNGCSIVGSDLAALNQITILVSTILNP